MPARRGPGRPPNPWRPRKIVARYDELANRGGHHEPTTRDRRVRDLHVFEEYLRKIRVDSDAVSVRDLIGFVNYLKALPGGYTSNRNQIWGSVRSYYALEGSADPEGHMGILARNLELVKAPKVVGEIHPHEAFPLVLGPKILEASRHVVQQDHGGNAIKSEAFVVTATLLYTGGRAQFYGLRVDQVRAALEEPDKFLLTRVKGGRKEVKVPIHDNLFPVWREWLDQRDFDGPMLFRHGRDPYAFRDGKTDWREAARNQGMNKKCVARILRGPEIESGHEARDGVETQLKKRFGIKERLTAHRFRKHVVTWMEEYGFNESERRLQVSHGADTITKQYSDPEIRRVQEKISKMDLGSAEWVAAHDPPRNLFAGGDNNNSHDVDEDQVAQLRAQLQEANDRNARLEKRLDALLERLEPKVVA